MFNRFTLDAMRVTHYMSELLNKDTTLWTPDEDAFYAQIYEEDNVVIR